MVNNIPVVYQDLIAKISSILKIDGSTAFNRVMVYNSQFSRMLGDGGMDYLMPIVLIEMKLSGENELSNKFSAFDITFCIRIIDQQYDGLEDTFDQNFEIYTLRDLVHKTLLLYKPVQCSPLQYVGENQAYRHGNLYQYTINYKTHYIDPTAYSDPIYVTGTTASIFYELDTTGNNEGIGYWYIFEPYWPENPRTFVIS